MSKYSDALILKTKRLFLFFFAIFLGLSACADSSGLPEEKMIVVPFSLEKIGNKIEKDFRVVKYHGYDFRLSFAFAEGNQTDRERVKALMGGYGRDKFGRAERPGVPTPVRLAIFLVEESGEKLVYEKEIDPFLTSWSANSFGKNIGETVLPPGDYRARLENLRSAPEFRGTSVAFMMRKIPKTIYTPK